MEEPSTGLEPDGRRSRRPKRGEAYWRGVVGRLDASGLSVAAFCEAEGLPAPSLYHWRRRIREADAAQDAAGGKQPPPRVIRLQPVVPDGSLGSGRAVAELVGGDRVTVDAADLPALIAALRASAAEPPR